MILNQISYLDCVVFVIFLIPQLLFNVNIFKLIYHGAHILPLIIFVLPFQFISERYFTPRLRRSPFVQRASPFQDIVIRCVRYAFAYLPANIGRVFFSKGVALPFFRFRMLRHGYHTSPIPWWEVDESGVRGIWIMRDKDQEPDLVVYYLHGGGFSMGSTYFYLEFLLAYFTLLTPHYRNPAIFALEYTLVPDASYPTQLDQTTAGYFHILSRLPNSNSSRICIAGDSAGATLVLSFLLSLSTNKTNASPQQQQRPGFATLISPWASLISDRNRNTRSDYLNANSLHLYGSQYAGHPANLSSFLVSPGACTKGSIWAKAVPSGGMTIMYGSEEVLGPEIRELVLTLRGAGVGVSVKEEPGGIHAWVVARVFLEGTLEGRVKGLRDLIGGLRRAIPRVGEEGEEGIMET